MQIMNWNDLRYLLALRRGRTLSAAARQLGVDDTTVSRRLKALEAGAGADLFQRQADATLHLTEIGAVIADYAERMEGEATRIGEALGDARAQVLGTVRLTSVPIVSNRLLAPRLSGLLKRHEHLTVELVADHRDLNLTRREADLAVRLARPSTGGTSVRARRIGHLDYAVFASCEMAGNQPDALPWIAFDDTMAHLPQSKWLARRLKSSEDALSGLRVMDAETAIEAVAAGLGKALLPRAIGDADDRLMRIAAPGSEPPPSREVWLLSHAEQRDLRSIATVAEWIEEQALASCLRKR